MEPLKKQALGIIHDFMGWQGLTLPASRVVFVVFLIVSAAVVAAFRAAQQVTIVDIPFVVLALLGGAGLTVAGSRPTLRSKVAFLWIFAMLFVILLRADWVLRTYGFLTGMGFLTTLDGPIFTGIMVGGLVVIMNDHVLYAVLFAGAAFVVIFLVTWAVRGLQHMSDPLDIAWAPLDWSSIDAFLKSIPFVAFVSSTVVVVAILGALGAFVTALELFDPTKLFTGEAGLPRATWMGIVGFLLLGLFVIVLRGLQSLTPLWDPGIGIVATSFGAAGFFVWGMGAFDPKMSAHGEEHHEEPAPTEDVKEPGAVLGTDIWKAALWTLVVLLVVGFFAFVPGGPYLRQTINPLASPTDFGAMNFQLPFGGPTVELSKLVLLLGFILFTMLSLAAFGGGLALLFYFLSRNVKEARKSKPTPEDLVPPEPVQALAKVGGGVAQWLQTELPKLLGQR